MNNLRGINVEDKFEDVIKDLAYNMDYEELESLTGFDANEISDIVQKDKYDEEIEDEVPEMEECLVIKEGDIIELGKHRIMCGDSTKKDNVDKLMNGQKADMVFTDPPYGVGYTGGTKKHEMIKNDDIDLMPFMTDIYKQLIRIINKKCSLYIWFASKYAPEVMLPARISFNISYMLIWNKNHAQFGNIGSHYKMKHEPCLYMKSLKGTHNWQGNTKAVTILEHNRAVKNEFHPTQKPVELVENCIINSSVNNQICIDLFLGSGSTLIACEKTGRICYGMELDQHYCSVIIERYCKYTDTKDIKINGKEVDWNKYKAGS